VSRTYRADDDHLTKAISEGFQATFEFEDKPIIAAQHDLMGGADFWSLKPVLLEGDIAGVRARRILARLIAGEQSARTAGVAEVPAGPAVVAE
jgi:Vanillate O-demethylase oxygenase C-terminal domain